MASFFASAEWVDEDAAFSIIRCAKADKHPDAVMLSAGIYRDGNDQPWTLPVVTKVKERIHNDPSLGHDYLPIPGDPLFLKGARSVALGTKYCLDPRIASVQTVAGTGANHVGALLLARSAKPKQVWFSNPTWINHPLIWEKADKHIQHKEYPYWNANTNSFDFEAMISRLNNEAEAGDIIVLQACAHNPTGVDPTKEQWKAIAALCQRRKLFPFFDSAYQGFASGNLEEDGWALQHFLDLEDMELCIAQSFSKNFGLYSERIGAIHVKTNSPKLALKVKGLLEQVTRSEISTPAAFGARIVGAVIDDEQLFDEWMDDLRTMSSRIQTMRKALYHELIQRATPGNWEHILKQIGMFSYIGVTQEQAIVLRDKYHVYLLNTGRVSMTGITEKNVAYVASCLDAVVRRTADD